MLFNFIRNPECCIQFNESTAQHYGHPLIIGMGKHEDTCCDKHHTAQLLLRHKTTYCKIVMLYTQQELGNGKNHCCRQVYIRVDVWQEQTRRCTYKEYYRTHIKQKLNHLFHLFYNINLFLRCVHTIFLTRKFLYILVLFLVFQAGITSLYIH